MVSNTFPETMTSAAFGAVVGVSERTVAGHRSAQRLPLLPDGRLDLRATLRLGYTAALDNGYDTPARAPAQCRGLGHLTNPGEWLFALAVQEMAYRTPVMAAIFAVHAGATCAQAFRAHRDARVAALSEAADLLTEAGIPHPPGCDGWHEAEMWDPERFSRPNWPHLAQIAGEPHDEAAWRAAAEELGEGQTEEGAD
jgi:hypothetical protein